jgi:hypothetical protein
MCFCSLALFALGEDKLKTPARSATEPKTPADSAAFRAKVDANRDSKISMEEVVRAANPTRVEGLRRAFSKSDVNKDGNLSAEEFKTLTSMDRPPWN